MQSALRPVVVQMAALGFTEGAFIQHVRQPPFSERPAWLPRGAELDEWLLRAMWRYGVECWHEERKCWVYLVLCSFKQLF
jgi:hypothetical protein